MKKMIAAAAVMLAVCLLFCSCAQNQNAKPLTEIFDSVKSEIGVSEMLEFSAAAELNRFYGIEEADVAEFAGGVNSSGVNQEEIVLVKASDADAASRIAEALRNRLNAKLNETKNYNPEQYAILETCSVDTDDLYVSMILSQNAAAIKEIYRTGIGLAK